MPAGASSARLHELRDSERCSTGAGEVDGVPGRDAEGFEALFEERRVGHVVRPVVPDVVADVEGNER